MYFKFSLRSCFSIDNSQLSQVILTIHKCMEKKLILHRLFVKEIFILKVASKFFFFIKGENVQNIVMNCLVNYE